MNKTKIEWVKNPDGSQGYTWNPITGCLNHVNGICKGGSFPCYAYKIAHGRVKSLYLRNLDIALPHENPKLAFDAPFYPRWWDKRYHELMPRYLGSKHYKRKGIFVCDMADLFGIGIPEAWTRQVLRVCEVWDGYRFYLLTKQPQNLIKFSPFPDNCWVGVTACNKTMVTLAQHYLSLIEARVKYISFEPLLEQMTNSRLHFKGLGVRIHWLIIGAQTKPYKPPKVEWVREIVEAADKAGIPVFLKNNLHLDISGQDTWALSPKVGKGELWRQEIPE